MSRRFKIVLSGAFAVLAVVLCLAYGESVRAEEETRRQETLTRYGGEVVSLVVATTELDEGQVVSAGDVTRRDWVSDLVPEGAVTDLDEVVGKKVTVAVASGAPVTQLNFRETGASVDVPSGMIGLNSHGRKAWGGRWRCHGRQARCLSRCRWGGNGACPGGRGALDSRGDKDARLGQPGHDRRAWARRRVFGSRSINRREPEVRPSRR